MLGTKRLLQRIEHLQPVPLADHLDVVQKLGILPADQLYRSGEAPLAEDADSVDGVRAVEGNVEEHDRRMLLL